VTDIEVKDDPARHRFEIFVDGAPGGFAAYRVKDDVVVVTHSEVDPGFQGQGLGSELVRQSLDQLRDRAVRVVPACPFYARYVAKHHDWDDILEDY
jgi:predicted GNAT family acetyltransferase